MLRFIALQVVRAHKNATHLQHRRNVIMVAYFCHHLLDNYVDLSYLYVDVSVIYYVDLSDHYVDLSEKYHHN